MSIIPGKIIFSEQSISFPSIFFLEINIKSSSLGSWITFSIISPVIKSQAFFKSPSIKTLAFFNKIFNHSP